MSVNNKKGQIAAILGAVIAVLAAIYAIIDNNPETTPDVTGTIEAVQDGVEAVRGNVGE